VALLGLLTGLTDRQALHQVLSRPEHRYLARQLCWVMTIERARDLYRGPRDPADLPLLVEAVHQPLGEALFVHS
jgi:hypothetical protein